MLRIGTDPASTRLLFGETSLSTGSVGGVLLDRDDAYDDDQSA
jgi:hypothetical protein